MNMNIKSKYQSTSRNIGSARQISGAPKASGESGMGRAAVLSVLALFLPPAGMLCAWRSSQVPILGKVLLSLVATVSLTVMLALGMSGSAGDRIMPTPSVPDAPGYARATPVPAAESRPDVAGQDAAPTPAPANDMDSGYGMPVSDDAPAEASTQPPAITVYTVRTNATLYHASDSCDGQINRRELLLSEAIAEGLSPCPKCNPPQ